MGALARCASALRGASACRCLRRRGSGRAKDGCDEDEQAPLGNIVFGHPLEMQEEDEFDNFKMFPCDEIFPCDAAEDIMDSHRMKSALDANSMTRSHDPIGFAVVHPIFDTGTQVEYYSETRGTWLHGCLQVVAEPGRLPTESAPEDLRVIYNVELPESSSRSSRARRDVPLHKLRLPLALGEPVDVYSELGAWCPAVVVQQRLPGMYKIKMAAEGHLGTFESIEVPCARLRRRFLPGCAVRRYKGPRDGWVEGLVASIAEADGQRVEAIRWSEAPVASDEADGSGNGNGDDGASVASDGTELNDEAEPLSETRGPTRQVFGMLCRSSTSARSTSDWFHLTWSALRPLSELCAPLPMACLRTG